MKRLGWIAFGVITHLLFAVTVVRLVPFLAGTSHGMLAPVVHELVPLPWYVIDGLLAVQFAVSHSWLLMPSTRLRLERSIPSPSYGCLFCTTTCASLLIAIECWQRSTLDVWRLSGAAEFCTWGLFAMAWVGLLYSLHLSGLGYQTGFTPWWAWARGRSLPRRKFEPRGAYRYLRHPVYLCFLALIWLTPFMSLDHAVLTLLWTIYIFVGSCLKDRRLLFYLGGVHRHYLATVPGYPLMAWGPLGRVPMPTEERVPASLAT